MKIILLDVLLDYGYFRNNHYRLTAVDLSRQKELDENPKSIQQIEFVGQLKELYADNNAIDAGNCDKFMFALTILEKMKEGRIKCSQRSAAIL